MGVDPFDLDGAVAVVTGAAGGIGRATVEALARHRARVVALDTDLDATQAVAERIGDAVYPLRCDVSDEASVCDAFEEIKQRFGHVGVLHNNAGIALGGGRGDGPADELDLATWKRTLDVNLTGCYLCTHHALPLMLAGGGGAIINTASIAGPFIGTLNTAYCASKAGVVGFTRALVITHAARGIRANAICPGSVRTPMSAAVLKTPEVRARLIEGIPSGRVAEPADVANLVVFLASPGGAYLNGAVITLDGGLTTY
jgi:NAD(P)-dependent dehydrogenase (short-subunit alcohol dehydrogenase family)